MQRNIVVITVPHGGCRVYNQQLGDVQNVAVDEASLSQDYSIKTRMCDRRAVTAAHMLGKALRLRGKEVVFFINEDVIRSDCDLNRLRCGYVYDEEPPMHTNIRQFLAARKNEIAWHVDMHSYPSRRLYPSAIGNEHIYALLLLTREAIQKAFLLQKYFGSSIDIARGSNANYLMYTFEQNGVRSLLIEVEEDPVTFTTADLQSKMETLATLVSDN